MLRTRGVLKENELYFVGDGNYRVTGGEGGLYRRDTRFLHTYRLSVDGGAPTPLSHFLRYPWWLREVSGDPNLGYTMTVGLERDLRLTGAELQDEWRLTLYTPGTRTLRLHLGADFRDMFEVRGWPGLDREVKVEAVPGGVQFSYTAQDGLALRTLVTAEPAPAWDGEALGWEVGQDTTLRVSVHCLKGEENPIYADLAGLRASYDAWKPPVTLADPRDAEVLTRSVQDLRSLLFDTPQGPFPAAGIPWFVAPFGRDSLIIAHMALDHRPELALGVARYLAAYQGVKHDPETLEQPGKILHEARDGELTRTGRTPHRPYYATADATPLFVWLVGRLAERFPALATALRPHWEAALAWLVTDGDPDGDGFIEYTPDPHGIRNQIWKDSGDSTFDERGVDAEGHIAVVEVQGYAYAAYRAAERLYSSLNEPERAAEWRTRASTLRQRFHDAFWWPERGYYVHGLNGDKTPLRVLVSNAAHALWTGIIPGEHAESVAKVVLGDALWTGWGVRTLGAGEPRFNPASYHNGSVWPHDTALIALGLERYGLAREATTLARALFDAARSAEDRRLPELFAGYARQDGPPVPYPAACHPQGWDAVIPLALAHLIAPGVEEPEGVAG